MSLVRTPHEIPAGAMALECHACAYEHPLDTHGDVSSLGDPLRCGQCGRSGFIPRSNQSDLRSTVADRYPGTVGEQFTAIPEALFTWRAAGLSPRQRILIITLERKRWRDHAGGLVEATLDMLGIDTGIPERTIKRELAALVADGWIVRLPQPWKNGPSPNLYDMRPVWQRLSGDEAAVGGQDGPRSLDGASPEAHPGTSGDIGGHASDADESPANVGGHIGPRGFERGSGGQDGPRSGARVARTKEQTTKKDFYEAQIGLRPLSVKAAA
jgi:hypothetical protein